MFETLFTSPPALSRHRNGPLAAERAAYRNLCGQPARPVTTRHSHLAQRLDTDGVPRFPVIFRAACVMLASKSPIAMSASIWIRFAT